MSETTETTQAKPEPKSFVRHAIELHPFQVPSFVTMAAPAQGPGAAQPGSVLREPPSFHLRELSPEVLANLCDRFRADVFEKAGKRPPRRRASKSAA